MGFTYYVPGVGTAPAEKVRTWGLGYCLSAAGTTFVQTGAGPDGQGGVLFTGDGHAPDAGPRPNACWRKIPKTKAWVCMDPAARPTPESLVRAEPLAGHPVRLNDGNDWLVPVARGQTEEDGDLRWYVALPQAMDLDDDGNWTTSGVTPRFRALWKIALKYWDIFCGAAAEHQAADGEAVSVTMTVPELADSATRALAANYRVGPAEIALLGLFDNRVMVEVLDALVDRPTLAAWSKKKQAADGLSTSAGRRAETPATAPR